ncbi:MAG TPA: hypothetical protein VII72_07580 [Myxococcota bacterium]
MGLRNQLATRAGALALVAGLSLVCRSAAADGWRPLAIGGGGFLTGMDFSPDGTTRCVRTDTYGAYCYDAESRRWVQVVTSTSMPSSDVIPGVGEGVYELRVAPSAPLRLYMALAGYVFSSTDRGTHWARTSFSRVPMDANDSYRTSGEKMAVDPINPDVVYLGTQSNGLWVTTTGGRSWVQESNVPATGRITGISFDPSGGNTRGLTNHIYAASAAGGLYRTLDAGVRWTLIPGGPSVGVTHGTARGGVYYAVSTAGKLWKYASGAWTDFTPKAGATPSFHSIAFDPSTPGRLVAASDSGAIHVSPDNGVTWQSDWYYQMSVTCPDAQWLCFAYPAVGLANSNQMFDPEKAGRLWMSAGTSPWYAQLPAGPPAISWTSQVVGIEQLVANTVIVPPGGKPVLASWDFPLFTITDPVAYPSSYSPTPPTFGAAWHIDWASSDPRFLVAFLCWGGPSQSSTSSDGGTTWKLFPSVPVGNDCDDTWGWGGTGAAASPTNWIWVPSNRRAPYYTTNGGVSWTKLSLPGVPDDSTDRGWGGLHWAFYLNRHIVAADRVNIGTFYLYHFIHGVFRSTDRGATWTLVKAGEVASWSGFNAKLQSVPGRAGHLFFTSGQQGDPRDPNPASSSFMRSTDGGVTWTAMPGVSEVYAFGFGKAQRTYPTIYIAGWVNGAYGIWGSGNEGSSWAKLGGDFALGSLDAVKTVDGDKDTAGRVYVGFAGSGYAYFSEPRSAP